MTSLFDQLSAAHGSARPHVVRRSSPEAVEKRLITWRNRLRANWAEVFAKLGNRAGTSEIAAYMDRASMSVHSSLSKMVTYGWVKRDGTIPHPKNGRDQIIWKWVAND